MNRFAAAAICTLLSSCAETEKPPAQQPPALAAADECVQSVAVRAAPSDAPQENLAALALQTCKRLVEAASAEGYAMLRISPASKLPPEAQEMGERAARRYAYESIPYMLTMNAAARVSAERSRLRQDGTKGD